MEKFNPYIRRQNLSWSIFQIKMLINEIIKNKSSSFISYAALECRIIIERLEFAPLVMAASSLEDESWKIEVERYKGIQKLNSKIKTLRYRYQTFTTAFSEAIFENISLIPFDYKKAEDLQGDLAKYIHIYTKADEDFKYDSVYVKDGIKLLDKALDFLENSCSVNNGAYFQGALDINSLSKEMRNEFNDWVNRKDEDIIALTERLTKIREKKNMEKIKID